MNRTDDYGSRVVVPRDIVLIETKKIANRMLASIDIQKAAYQRF